MNKDILKRVIIENQEFVQNIELVQRPLSFEIQGNMVLVGPRRAGKTFNLFQIIQNEMSKQTAPETILYINFEDERLIGLGTGDLDMLLDAYRELYAVKPVLFLDEIQIIPGWDKFVRRLADQEYRLFTISEYYDRDRPAFYKSIQSVRDNNMDMTGWLDYFLTGLETQMVEVRERGEQVIRRDVLAKKHRLNHRQTKALGYLFQHRKLTIQDFEALCPSVNRRSLQRDLKGMINKKLIVAKGATNQLIYWLEG